MQFDQIPCHAPNPLPWYDEGRAWRSGERIKVAPTTFLIYRTPSSSSMVH
jgi:hypothetical protein